MEVETRNTVLISVRILFFFGIVRIGISIMLLFFFFFFSKKFHLMIISGDYVK